MRKLFLLLAFLVSISSLGQNTDPILSAESAVGRGFWNKGSQQIDGDLVLPTTLNSFTNPDLRDYGKLRYDVSSKRLKYSTNVDWKTILTEDDNTAKIYEIQNATVSNVRNDQPSFVTLDNGNILCAFNHFGAEGSDISEAYIAGKISTDGGKTWGAIFTLQSVIAGTDNVLVPSLFKRPDGKILMLFFAQTEPVPTPESRIYKKIFNQDMTVFSGPTDLALPTGYYGGVGSDRIFLDESNGNLLYPVGRLLSGDGTSYGSTYESTILRSTNNGDTWTDLDLHIGASKLMPNGFGGGTEPGIYYTPQGLYCYFRTLLGYTYAVKLNSSYAPTGSEFALFESANAMASIKWIPSLNMAVGGRTRLLDNNQIGDNVRKYLDLMASTDGIYNWVAIDEIDHAIQDVDWYVNQPVVFDYNDNLIVGYNNSKTGIKTASLFNKIYPKSIIKYQYVPESYSGISQNKGRLVNGIQTLYSTDNTANVVSLKYPRGGNYYNSSSSATGAFKITFPNNRNATITIKGRVQTQSVANNFSFEITCNTSDMANYNNVRVDYPEVARSLNVRFVNGVNPVVLIGDLSTSWNSPNIVIDEVIGSKAAYLNELIEGWSISLESSSYGTVAQTIDVSSNAWFRGAGILISNPPAGTGLTVSRNGFGYQQGVSASEDGYINYNLSGSAAFNRVFGNGNHIIGSSIGTDNGYRLDVQGTFRSTGEATVATPTVNTSATTKLYVDSADALKANINSPTFTGTPTTPSLTFTPTASPTYAAGKLVYDSDNESLTFYNNDSNVALQIGQESWIRVRNDTGSTITNGAAVYISGTHASGLPQVSLAQANSSATTIVAGLATEAIPTNSIGYITSLGLVRNIDTSAFTAGSTVFLSATTPGALVSTSPTAPNFRYRVGLVTRSNATTGTIHVTPTTAALGNGTANQLFGINNAGTAQEVKSIVGTANQVTVTHSANTITLGLGFTILTAAAVLDFPNVSSGTSSELTITVTGAADGDCVVLGVPNVSSNANSCYTARVSAANTVTVKFNNYSTGAINPASGAFTVKVLK